MTEKQGIVHKNIPRAISQGDGCADIATTTAVANDRLIMIIAMKC